MLQVKELWISLELIIELFKKYYINNTVNNNEDFIFRGKVTNNEFELKLENIFGVDDHYL